MMIYKYNHKYKTNIEIFQFKYIYTPIGQYVCTSF